MRTTGKKSKYQTKRGKTKGATMSNLVTLGSQASK